MFTKNIKSIGIIALIVVIVLVISAVIATSNDKKVSAQVQNSANDTAAKIDALNKTIADLNKVIADLEKGLASAEDVAKKQAELIEALKAAGVELENWDAATGAYAEKLVELNEVYDEFTKYEDKDGNPIDVANVYDEDLAAVVAKFYTDALFALERASSVEAQDAIIAGLKADLEAIPTRVEKLVAALDAVEADEVTLADYENLVLANRLLAHGTTVGYEKDQKDALQKRFDTAFVAYYVATANEYITLVEALPTVAQVTVANKTNQETIEKMMSGLFSTELGKEGLYTLQSAELKAKADKAIEDIEADLDDATTDHNEFQVRLSTLLAAEEAAKLLNKVYDEVKLDEVKANVATLAVIKGYEEEIANWAKAYGIVTKADDKDYVAANYELVHFGKVAEIRATYEAQVADLKTAANAYMEAVKALGEKVTPDSKTALDAAQTAYEAMMDIAGIKTSLAEIDTMIETKEPAKAGVEVSNTTHEKLAGDHKTILDLIAQVEKYVNETLRPEYCAKADEKDHVCDAKKTCHVRPENYDETLINETDVENIDGVIETLVCVYDQDETVIDATVLAEYKVIRFVPAKKAILAEIEASANTATEKANYTRLVNNAVMSGAFVEGVDKDGEPTGQFADTVNAVHATIAEVRAELK